MNKEDEARVHQRANQRMGTPELVLHAQYMEARRLVGSCQAAKELLRKGERFGDMTGAMDLAAEAGRCGKRHDKFLEAVRQSAQGAGASKERIEGFFKSIGDIALMEAKPEKVFANPSNIVTWAKAAQGVSLVAAWEVAQICCSLDQYRLVDMVLHQMQLAEQELKDRYQGVMDEILRGTPWEGCPDAEVQFEVCKEDKTRVTWRVDIGLMADW